MGDASAERFTALRLERSGGVATVTLDRPAALNSLTIRLKEELLAAFRSFVGDRAVRVVIITGAGRAFCAGQDLRERLEPRAVPLEVELRDRYNPIIQAMRALDQPIIGAINGVAAGAGASLAFACDVRLAAESASFVLAFGRIGLVPDSGATWLLPRLVGAARAAEIALVGDPISAAEAERIGLVRRVVPASDLPGSALELAERLAGLAPRATALTKRLLDRAWTGTLDEALEAEADAQGVVGVTADHTEGLAAFLEKRPPRFGGD